MGLVASLFSALKAEVEWLITSLAVANGNNDGAVAADTQAADATGAAHRDESAINSHTAISIIAEQPADQTADFSGAQHAITDDALNASAIAQLLEGGTQAPANLLINADLVIDIRDDSGAAPSLGLTPNSWEQSISGLSGISAPISDSPRHDQDLHVTPTETDSQIGVIQPHWGAGEFTLASLAPQLLGGFAHGKPGGGGGGGGNPPPADYTTPGTGNFHITLHWDSSVGNAPANDANGYGFVADMEKVANFFASNYTTPHATAITINVGFGEIAGTGLGGGALGESESYYVAVPGSNAAAQYATLKSLLPAGTLPASDPAPATSHQYWVTTAEGKALGFSVAQNPDGYIGFSGASNIFDYNPNDGGVSTGQYDFIGVAAHEISEVMGRATLNGAKDFGHGYADYSPLDLFHFSDIGGRTFSGRTPGYFSLDGTESAAQGYKEFNTSSSGDFSDWAVSNPPDAYDWSGGLGQPSPVTYADFLVMEAVGWTGSSSGPANASWTWDGI